MSLIELLAAANTLSRADRLLLIAQVADGLIQDEEMLEDSYQNASLRNSPEIAQALEKMLDTHPTQSGNWQTCSGI